MESKKKKRNGSEEPRGRTGIKTQSREWTWGRGEGEGEAETKWESGTDIYTLPNVK